MMTDEDNMGDDADTEEDAAMKVAEKDEDDDASDDE